MALRELFGKLVNNRTETTEKHSVDQLKTRYYKTSKDKAIKAVESVVQSSGWQVKRIEEERGEMIAQPKNGGESLLIATIVTVKPFRTAVDFSCSTGTSLPSDFGKSKKIVLALYDRLDQELPFVGSGIGEELL
jgi:hypothetical protein